MSNLITKQFNDSIVTFDLTSGMMVSLTDMAKACNKQVGHWLELKSTKDYLQEYSASIGITIDEILIVKQGGNGGGTWANQDIALYFAQWLSPKFHIWCNRQIKELLTTGTVTIAKPQHTLPQTFAEALQLAADQERQLEQQAPLVNFAATVQQSSALIDLNKLAKIISDNVIVIGRNNLMQLLRARGFLNQDNTPSQKSINAGLMKAVEKTYQRSDGEIGLSVTAQITGAGQVYFCSNVRKFLASSDKLEVAA